MRIAVCDGNVVFATHLISITDARVDDDEFMRDINATTDWKITCFSEEEKSSAEKRLAALNVQFTVESLAFSQFQKDKVAGKKYTSRSEAIAHLNDEIDEPESEVIPNLKKRQREHDEKIKDYDDRIRNHDDAIKEFKELREVNLNLQQQISAMKNQNTELLTRLTIMEAKNRAI